MLQSSYSLSFDDFRALASQGNLIPLYKEILADFETPVSAFTTIDHGPSAYLLESIEGGDNWARYSFLGSGSPVVIREDRGEIVIEQGSKVRRLQRQSRLLFLRRPRLRPAVLRRCTSSRRAKPFSGSRGKMASRCNRSGNGTI